MTRFTERYDKCMINADRCTQLSLNIITEESCAFIYGTILVVVTVVLHHIIHVCMQYYAFGHLFYYFLKAHLLVFTCSKTIAFLYESTIYSWGIGFNTPQCVRSKTTLIMSSVGGAGFFPPPRKMNTFFLRSLAFSVPIYRHFQSNGDNWRGIKH